MYWKKAPSTVWSGLTKTWNRDHRLRVGVVLLALWYAVFLIDNPTPAAITNFDQWGGSALHSSSFSPLVSH
jgi:hypothetical protein